ncbi:sigma-70 family RNA polymerase sigma factor [Acanthopleuribacter pedis]|uniref:Sigma-70 family RNA polymerase sigma factor n=1 Tax=Acanthopleuribacter pedis TaxID=442870 RepID=A0A8J7U3U8_9BACT|nr:sigma-70 family RNA polymerase sigma factor [Acanthopleuribacter pedis]MBO1317646.1 sigma-70 family RNA polymerase sigma factor [Acanthopleuribacter pedis]
MKTKDSEEIEYLIQAFRQGDPQARDALFAKITPLLRGMVRKRFAGFQRETMALQTTLIINDMLLAIEQKKHLPWKDWVSLQRFIGKVLNDYQIDKRRRKAAKRRGGHIPIIGLDRPEEVREEMDSEKKMMLDLALKKLNKYHPRAARVLDLKAGHGLNSQKIAARLHITEYEVRKLLDFCRKWLNDEISRQ